jgi:hypothetical protein
MTAHLLCLVAALAAALGAQTYDLLLQGGHVIDPKNSVNALRDIAISGGKIARVATGIPAANARRLGRLAQFPRLQTARDRPGKDPCSHHAQHLRTGDAGKKRS